MKVPLEQTFNHVRHRLGRSTVPLDYGHLRIVAHSETERFIRSHSAAKEPETVAWIETMPKGSVFWDAGANIGAYSLIAASRGIEVIAFEPHPGNVLSLQENKKLNGFKFPAFEIALSDHDGLMYFEWSSAEPGTANHHQIAKPVGPPVTCCRGDSMIGRNVPAPDFIKIDTDGGELEILTGLGVYLETVQSILIETEAGSELAIYGFKETGRWAIPGHPLENRRFDR